MRRLLALLVVLVAVPLLQAPATSPALADPLSSCTTSAGVLVVVDFGHFGGPVTRGCDVSITTGWDALHDAGFSTVGTVHDGTGFVCRIDDHPDKAQDACFNTPPATAYWSYWHADAGSSNWSYSRTGAQSYHPPAGSIDAWVFGGSDTEGSSGGPAFTPAQVRAGSLSGAGPARSTTAHPPPTTAQRPSPSAVSHGGARSPARQATRRTSVSGRDIATTSAGNSATKRSRRPSGASAASGAGSAPGSAAPSSLTIVDATPAAATTTASSGSALPAIVGLALVALLGGGAGWAALRRRRADAADH